MKKYKKAVKLLVAAAVLAAQGVIYTLPPCETEDAEYNCYWDASEQGNGQGTDFIVFEGQVFYP